ncbi:hypothetical protein NE857_29610 [Nocardiopsis exhalans]|uniref:Uncharacterized protein n=1 Tax=Nocardiopsis exhalans TaxID=163604 RepID=A0ABY5D7K2_9ACTN|nr:hypothetical protein [Nocardiopsis exhalans]USY19360.1 hypothetical protein NE857_29610 [Nocardiopsis exhalans]
MANQGHPYFVEGRMVRTVKFSDFGAFRTPDFLLALGFKSIRGTIVDRVKSEKEFTRNPDDDRVHLRLLAGRISVSFFILFAFVNVPLILAGVVKQNFPNVSIFLFSVVYFYGPLRVFLFMASLFDMALCWMGGKFSDRNILNFPNTYGRGRLVFAFMSFGVGVWAIYSGMVWRDVYS